MDPRPGDAEGIRERVREGYTRVAERAAGCCGGTPPQAAEVARRAGYADEEIAAAPEGANLGVGCGNPTAIERLRPGETVLDLGSGAGFDAFLAARAVGASGRVIGVDMTEAMLERARENAQHGGFANVEFRSGTIEALPVEDESVDVVLSNCVINLSPQKDLVFREAFRVLRPGGRLQVSDIVLERPLPEALRASVQAYVGCIAGASLREDYLRGIREAGFRELRVESEAGFADVFSLDDPLVREAMERQGVDEGQARRVLAGVKSIHVFARK